MTPACGERLRRCSAPRLGCDLYLPMLDSGAAISAGSVICFASPLFAPPSDVGACVLNLTTLVECLGSVCSGRRTMTKIWEASSTHLLVPFTGSCSRTSPHAGLASCAVGLDLEGIWAQIQGCPVTMVCGIGWRGLCNKKLMTGTFFLMMLL